MSDPNGGADEGRRNRRPATAGFSAARGAALVAIAVIIGIVLLQAIDDGNDGPVGDGGTASTTTTTTPTSTDSSGSAARTTSTTKAAPLPPAQVTVRVLNGSGRRRRRGDAHQHAEGEGLQDPRRERRLAAHRHRRLRQVRTHHRVHDAVAVGPQLQGAGDADSGPRGPGRRLHRRHRELTSRRTPPSPTRSARSVPTRRAPRWSWTSTARSADIVGASRRRPAASRGRAAPAPARRPLRRRRRRQRSAGRVPAHPPARPRARARRPVRPRAVGRRARSRPIPGSSRSSPRSPRWRPGPRRSCRACSSSARAGSR